MEKSGRLRRKPGGADVATGSTKHVKSGVPRCTDNTDPAEMEKQEVLKNKRSSTSASDALQRGSQSEKSPLWQTLGKVNANTLPRPPPRPHPLLLSP